MPESISKPEETWKLSKYDRESLVRSNSARDILYAIARRIDVPDAKNLKGDDPLLKPDLPVFFDYLEQILADDAWWERVPEEIEVVSGSGSTQTKETKTKEDLKAELERLVAEAK